MPIADQAEGSEATVTIDQLATKAEVDHRREDRCAEAPDVLLFTSWHDDM